MIENRWNGERISIAPDSPVGLIQCHVARYVWAMHYCVEKTVLDVGCGTGYGTWLLGQIADEVTGIDKSVEAIAEARRDFSGVFLHMDIESAPKPVSWCFDTIVAFEVMEHLDDVDVGMEAVKYLLSDNGNALISLPLHQPSKWHRFRDYGYAEWYDIVTRHFHIVSDGVFWQPIEEAVYRDGNVNIRKMPEDQAETGIVIVVLEK